MGTLSDQEIFSLLREKWISPIMERIYKIPDDTAEKFASEIESIKREYEHPLSVIEKDLKQTEMEFAPMIDELEGSESDMEALEALKQMISED